MEQLVTARINAKLLMQISANLANAAMCDRASRLASLSRNQIWHLAFPAHLFASNFAATS